MVEQINIKPDTVLDLGKKGCGDLAISLMKKMKTVEGGQVLEVHALDTGAQNDIPAWCRMTNIHHLSSLQLQLRWVMRCRYFFPFMGCNCYARIYQV